MLNAKQGNYWDHFNNVFGMTRSLTVDWTGTSRTRSQHSTTRLSRRWSLTGDWTRTSRTRSQHSTTRLSRRLSLTGDWTGTSRTQIQHSNTRLSRRQYRTLSQPPIKTYMLSIIKVLLHCITKHDLLIEYTRTLFFVHSLRSSTIFITLTTKYYQ